MKQCPKCLRDYSDDTLRFCLDDGTVLIDSFATQPSKQPTVPFMGQQTLHPQGGTGARAQEPRPPSNAGVIFAVLGLLLGFGSWFLVLTGLIASAASVENTVVGGLIIFSIPGACLGMLLGLIALYRAYRAADRKGAKKTAIFSVIVNVAFLLALAGLMILGLAGTMMK